MATELGVADGLCVVVIRRAKPTTPHLLEGMIAGGSNACDSPLPSSPSICFGAATDDVIILSKEGRNSSITAVQRLDDAFIEAGIIRNTRKDVNGVLDGECVGVGLEGAIPPACALALLWAVHRMLQRGEASPAEVEKVFGTQQWYDLLNRPKTLMLPPCLPLHPIGSHRRSRTFT